jgi:hypothetical protein
LDWYDRSLAFLLDRAIGLTGYECRDTQLSFLKNPGPVLNVASLGEALVANEKIHRNRAPEDFAAAIPCQLSYEREPLGTVTLRWHPSRGFLAFITGFAFYRLDRAYLWPQVLLNEFPGWFPPEVKHEPFEMEWHELHWLMASRADRPELNFLKEVVTSMRLFNPDADEYSGKGRVTYYGHAPTNKTIFVFEVANAYPGALSCEQHLQTNYNPFSDSVQVVRGKVGCLWP